MNINSGQHELVSYFMNETSTGMAVGIRNEGEDLHLECCIDPIGQINCHIKHNGERLWEHKVKPMDLGRNLRSEIRESIVSWDNKDEVLAIDTGAINELTSLYDPTKTTLNIDLKEIGRKYFGIFEESRMTYRKLGNIRKDEVIMGIPDGHEDSILMAFPKHQGVIIPLSYDKGIASVFPPVTGMFRYLEIADELGIMGELDQLPDYEVKSLLFELGFDSM